MKPVRLVGLCLAAGASAFAQVTPVPPITAIQAFGNTVQRVVTIQLGPPSNIIPIVPFPVSPPITFARGTRLQLLALDPGTKYGPVQWYKDGTKLPAAGATLEIASSSSTDSGVYSAVVKNADGTTTSSDLARVFVSRDGQRLANVSVRARVDAAQPAFLTGFVVEPGPGDALVLVRAVGPALTGFGVRDGLSAPQVRILNARGEVIALDAPPFMFPTLAQATQFVGAFPLPSGGKDIARLLRLSPGSYTAEVSSADAGAGTVLLELYDVPY